jgi:hypothetical protein
MMRIWAGFSRRGVSPAGHPVRQADLGVERENVSRLKRRTDLLL